MSKIAQAEDATRHCCSFVLLIRCLAIGHAGNADGAQSRVKQTLQQFARYSTNAPVAANQRLAATGAD